MWKISVKAFQIKSLAHGFRKHLVIFGKTEMRKLPSWFVKNSVHVHKPESFSPLHVKWPSKCLICAACLCSGSALEPSDSDPEFWSSGNKAQTLKFRPGQFSCLVCLRWWLELAQKSLIVIKDVLESGVWDGTGHPGSFLRGLVLGHRPVNGTNLDPSPKIRLLARALKTSGDPKRVQNWSKGNPQIPALSRVRDEDPLLALDRFSKLDGQILKFWGQVMCRFLLYKMKKSGVSCQKSLKIDI